MVAIAILNTKSLHRERKPFKTKEQADAYFERKKAKVNLACEPSEKTFTYVNDWGTKLVVTKLY